VTRISKFKIVAQALWCRLFFVIRVLT
jgi:hypothetical protein